MKKSESFTSIITEDLVLNVKKAAFEELKRASIETTGHGLPRMFLARSWYMRIMWFFFTLISVGLCGFMVYRSVSQYASYDVTTQISIINQEKMIFPAISICNANPLVTPGGSWYIQDYYQTKYNLTFEYFADLFSFFYNGSIENENDWLIYQTYHPDFDSWDERDRSWFGYWVENMISECKFHGNPCELSEFEKYYDPIYGNCYKFNANSSNNPLYSITRQGEGFYVEIFVGMSDATNDYYHQPRHKGAVITIDTQEGFPIKKEGIVLSPGKYAKIKLNRVTTTTLPFPYGDCQEASKVNTILSREMAKHGYNYTRRNCMTFCEQKLIIEELGCYDLRLPAILDAPPCFDKETFRRIAQIRFDFSKCLDDCPFECSSTQIDYAISYDDFPTYIYFWEQIHYRLEFYEFIFGTFDVKFETFKDSIASVFIFYDDLTYTDISDSPSIQLADLVANIGGTLGLFVGVSVLSFAELIELCINFFLIYSRKLKEEKIVKKEKSSKV